ncbi:MAG TPA: MFS transporter [Actinobacteria bacterium]|nr:MFS transporter [Actinomycetota bacterium]
MLTGRRWAALAVLSGALALISLDNTIVNVALPSLQEDLDATTAQLQWVVDAYSVLFAGTLLLAGALGDRFGRRRVLLVGLVVFGSGSLAAGMVSDASALTLCRAVMGVGGAFIMPSTLSILVQVFRDPRERAQAIGIWAAVAGVGVALGPIIGGLLLERFSWQAIFLVNPPLIVVVLVAAILFVPESRDPDRPRLDMRGAALSSLGLIALVVTIIELPESGLDARTLTTGGVAVGALALFVWWERRAPRPLLPMELFRQRTFVVAVVTVGLVYFALMGAMFLLPQFLQLVQSMSPLESGVAMLPGAGGLLVASLVSPAVAYRLGTRATVVTGLVLVLMGMALSSLYRVDTAYPFIALTLGLIGVGMGLALPQATNAVLASVPRERSGMGSAVNDAVGELGGSFGVAILGALMSVFYRERIQAAIASLGDRAAEVPSDVLDAVQESLASAALVATRLPDVYAAVVHEATGTAFVAGMTWALLLGSVVVAGGVVLAWLMFPRQIERVEE